MDDPGMVGIKQVTAFLGAAVLLVIVLMDRRAVRGLPRLVADGLLALVALFSFTLWWNLGFYHFPNRVHVWDTFHYYMGAKYFPELGYTRLYGCTAVAEVESGLFPGGGVRKVRDLATNRLLSWRYSDEEAHGCKSRFSLARWQAFVSDMALFKSRTRTRKWDEILADHGYNATPVWGIMGSVLANTQELATGRQIALLTTLDSIVLVVMWLLVWWAFGWRTTAVATLFWGTNFLGRYWWNGGSFLRMDWLLFTVAGICLLKKGRPALAGAALVYAALLRVFPAFILGGLALKVLIDSWRSRKLHLSMEQGRVVKGAGLALGVLLPLSVLVAGGGKPDFSAWSGFIQNSRKHLSTPLNNNVGLKTILSSSEETREVHLWKASLEDPYEDWRNARLRTFAGRKTVFAGLCLLALALLGLSVAGEEDWVAVALGVGLIPIAAELTCYYYTVLLALGLLAERRRSAGVLLVLFAGLSCALAPVFAREDDAYLLMSGVVLLLVLAIWTTFALARPGARPERTRDPGNAGPSYYHPVNVT